MRKMNTSLLGAISVISILGFGLTNLSGCVSTDQPPPPHQCAEVVGVGDIVIDLTKNNINLNVEGDDEILPCLNGPIYTATAFGWNFIGELSGVKWVTSGDIQIQPGADANYNPVSIIGTKDNGSGTLSLVTLDREGCPGGEVLAEKGIDVSFANILTITSDVCINPAVKTGAGKLRLLDKADKLPLKSLVDCVWSITAGNATLTPDKIDKTLCFVSNVTGDFTVSCQVSINNACKSANKLSFPITVSNCTP